MQQMDAVSRILNVAGDLNIERIFSSSGVSGENVLS